MSKELSAEEIVQRYESNIRAIARGYKQLIRLYGIDDLVQEVNLEILEAIRLGHLRDNRNLRGWIGTITRNRFRDMVDKARRRTGVQQPSSFKEDPPSFREGFDQHRELERKEEIELVRRGIAHLTRDQRLVLALRAGGMSYVQIAAEYGGPVSTWEMRYKHALNTLKKKATPHPEERRGTSRRRGPPKSLRRR